MAVSCRHTVISVIFIVVSIILNLALFLLPFVLFTAKVPADASLLYVKSIPIYVIPVISILISLISLCAPLVAAALHALSALVTAAGGMVYHILYLQYQINAQSDPVEFILPLVLLSCCVVMSLVQSLDMLATFIERRRSRSSSGKGSVKGKWAGSQKHQVNQYVKVADDESDPEPI